MTRLVADRRLWLTPDKERLAEEDSPEAAFLLAAEGRPVPSGEVDRLGLDVVAGRVVQAGPGPAVYADMDKAELEALAEERGLEVEGTGSGGNVLKADLVTALEASDAAEE